MTEVTPDDQTIGAQKRQDYVSCVARYLNRPLTDEARQRIVDCGERGLSAREAYYSIVEWLAGGPSL